MVAPVTDLGLNVRSRTFSDGPVGVVTSFYDEQHRYRQVKPFTLILPYHRISSSITKYSRASFPPGIPADADGPFPFTLNWTSLENKSYDKLRNKIYDKVGAGVDFAEWKQSARMIASSATTLFKAYRAVKQLRFADAASALRMKYLPKGVSKLKSAGNNWLEFHFGWEPLVGDIYDGVKALADPVKSFDLERARTREILLQQGSTDFGSIRDDWTAKGWLSSQQGCRVKFATPGSNHTLDQWGISNPAVIAWELIPFSFCVDWFVNVGDFLSSQTDFAGMTLESIYRTRRYEIDWTTTRSIKPGFGSGQNSISVRTVGLDRFTTLSGVTLEVKRIKPPSVVRGATAVSLLVQAMTSLK